MIFKFEVLRARRFNRKRFCEMRQTHAEMIDEVTRELKEPFTRKQIIEAILKRYSQTRPINVDSLGVDISGCCVNLRSRKHLPGLPKLLVAIGRGRYRRFTPKTDGRLVIKTQIAPKKVGPVTKKKCPRIKDRTAKQIATFLIRKYQEKSENFVEDFKLKGFTSESLTSDKSNLFKFMVLVAYDRYPFVPYEIVWERDDPESAYAVLQRKGLLDIDTINRMSGEDLDKTLKNCIIKKGLHLHNSNPKDEKRGTRFSRVLKEIASNEEIVMNLLTNVKNTQDTITLHRVIDGIYGFGPTITSKFIMYTIRDMEIGNVPVSDLEPVAKHLLEEQHNKKWVKRLEDPLQGGREGLLQEIEQEMKEDPMAIDYFFTLDRNFCSKDKCDVCEL